MDSHKKIGIRALIISLIIGTLLFLGLLVIIISEVDRGRQKLELATVQRYSNYHSKVEYLFNDNISLLKGYMAFLQTQGEMNGDDTEKYLSRLIVGKESLIKSVSIIKDTTIIFVYPKVGNEAALGVDLAKIEKQSEAILYAKNTLETVFQGPMDLIQGGAGIISRIPITIDGTYWGQISVVLDAQQFVEAINAYAEEEHIQVALYKADQYPGQSFNQMGSFSEQSPLVMDMIVNNIQWKAEVLPKEGWTSTTWNIFLWGAAVLGIVVILGILLFTTLYTRGILKTEVITDHMTGLFNRNFLEDYETLLLERATRTNTQVAAVLINLNQFKKINDKHGHKAGDIVIMTVASRLKVACRGTEAVFRLGSDEFLLLFPDIHSREVMSKIIQRIKQTLSQPIPFKGNVFQMTCSVGLAMFPEDGSTLDQIMNKADETLFKDKSNN